MLHCGSYIGADARHGQLVINRGFTLLELTVSLLIISAAVVTVLPNLNQSARMSTQAKTTVSAIQLARNLLNEIQLDPKRVTEGKEDGKFDDFENVDIVILSSTLQYFEDWEDFVQNIINKKPRHIIIDRHPLSNDESKIFVQLNNNYYSEEVTYPLHICNENEFLNTFADYQIVKRWNSDFDPDYFKGFHFLRVEEIPN